MALYSVWSWDRNSYRIYSTPTPVSVGDDPTPPKPVVNNPIGASPDTGINPLPGGARFMGYDVLARGEIRRMPGGVTDLGNDAGAPAFLSQPIVIFAAGAIAATVYFTYWKKRSR